MTYADNFFYCPRHLWREIRMHVGYQVRMVLSYFGCSKHLYDVLLNAFRGVIEGEDYFCGASYRN